MPYNDNYSSAKAFDGFLQRLQEGGSSKGTDVRKPDRFSGKDRSKFRTFKAQLKLVFRANPNKFSTGTKKVTYACSYLDDLAFQWYENTLEDDVEPEWYHDFELFLEELHRQFGEVNAEQAAERKLNQLYMSSGSRVVDYITKFNTQANLLSWNSAAKASTFRRGLAPRIKDDMAKLVEFNTGDIILLQETAVRLDSRYWEREDERQHKSRGRYNAPATTTRTVSSTVTKTKIPDKYARRMDPIRPFSRPGQSSSYQPARATTSYDRKDSKRQLPLNSQGKITEAEREKRMREGACIYCGEKGHIQPNCPKRPSSNVRYSDTSFHLRAGN